jgi:oxygen-independent coproporphyrinogen-3 oxidase
MIAVQDQTTRSVAAGGETDAALPSVALIEKYSRPGPRYTSYPAVPYWPAGYGEVPYRGALADLGRRCADGSERGISLYVHVPFCEKRCTFCACNVVVSRAHERGGRYIDAVTREMDSVIEAAGGGKGVRPPVTQMHWGGGTPTWLSSGELRLLFDRIAERFELLPDREQSLEVDPRVTTAEQLETLRASGLNRLSMGVQDIDPKVQRAINRDQPLEQTEAVIRKARELGIGSVSVDLVYGLPFQTPETFRRTVRAMIELGVDRAAVYNFAYLPDRLKHQKAIREESLPSARARIDLFRIAAEEFARGEYDLIGMDHFAKRTDELSIARREGTMQRNFMGYTTRAGRDLLAFGVSAISRVGRDFAQNDKETGGYSRAARAGKLPVRHGMRLSDEDLMRESVIQSLMCYGSADLDRVQREHGVDLLAGAAAQKSLAELEGDGLVEWGGQYGGRQLRVTVLGRYFVRNIAMMFDGYLGKAPSVVAESGGQVVQVRFSKTV